MAGTDNLKVTVRERPLSDDINDLQSMLGRALCDALQGMHYSELVSGNNPMQTTAPEGVILGGLSVSAAGLNVAVSPGALLQNNGALLPVPGTYDSNVRLAFLRTVTQIVAPVPGVDTYYALEGRMTEVVVTTPSRDVLDPVTGSFVPTVVDKHIERRIELRFNAGSTTAPPSPTTGWVPLAVVFRGAGAGVVASTDIQDARVFFDPSVKARPGELSPVTRSVEFPRSYLNTASRIPADDDLTLKLDMMVIDSAGRKAFAKSVGFVDVSIFDQQTGIAFPGADGARKYLYLFHGSHPVSDRYAGVAHRGYIVVSDVAPGIDNVNSAAIACTAVAGGSIGQGSAVCIGSVVSNGVGWYPMAQVGRKVSCYRLATSAAAALPTVVFSSSSLPANAKVIDCRLNVSMSAGGAGSVAVTEPGASSSFANATELIVVNSAAAQMSTRITIPWPKNGSNEICSAHAQIVTATSMSLEVMGWEF